MGLWGRLLKTLDELLDARSCSPCEHRWRPCVQRVHKLDGSTSLRPGRMCGVCGHLGLLSMEEFYAYFGRMPW